MLKTRLPSQHRIPNPYANETKAERDAPVIVWRDAPAAMNEERAAKLIEPLKLKPGISSTTTVSSKSPPGGAALDLPAIRPDKALSHNKKQSHRERKFTPARRLFPLDRGGRLA